MRSLNNRIITLFATVLMCIVFTACTSAVDSSFNYAEIVDEGAWEGAVDRKNSRAFVSIYYWDGSEEGKRIEATTLDNCTVTKYGGFYGRGLPMQFSVLPLKGNINDTNIPEDADVEDVTFTLVVTPEIRNIILSTAEIYYTAENPDGTTSYCHIVYEIELDDTNPYFEIKDGHLYNEDKSDSRLESIPARYIQK